MIFARFMIFVTALAMTSVCSSVEWQVNGFASAGGGMLSEENVDYAGYVKDDVTFSPDSILGVQVTAQVNERFSGTVQLVSRGSEDFEPEVEWAYLSYQVTDNLMVRGGRLRPPFFIVSDYLDVGYAYPWVRPPQEVYRNVPLTNYDGADLVYSRGLGDWFATVQIYGGSEDGTQVFSGTIADRELDSLMGIAVTGQKDEWTLRASYHQADVTFQTAATSQLFGTLSAIGFGAVAADLNSVDKAANFVEVAMVYDNEDWFVRGEATQTDFSRGFLSDQTSWYVSGGVQMGAFLPYVMIAHVKSDEEPGYSDPIPLGLDPGLDVLHFTVDGVAAITKADDWAYTIGTRWDALPRTAVKLEYTRVDPKLPGEADYGLLSLAVDVLF